MSQLRDQLIQELDGHGIPTIPVKELMRFGKVQID